MYCSVSSLAVEGLKGNCNGFFFLLLAFLSSPRSISKCGKISKLLVTRVFTILPAVGGAYLYRKYVNGLLL